MKTVIFGASGYLGSHTVEQLVLAGHEVTCIVRQSSERSFLDTLPVTILTSSFESLASVAGEIPAGCAVINCVADTRMHICDAERRKVEVALTSRLFQAAAQAGANRFIQLSTVMVYGFDRPETAVDEDYPPKPTYSYSRISLEREQALLDLKQGTDMELLILRPSNTVGKRDQSVLPVLNRALKTGKFSVIGGGRARYSCMDARDVGRAMVHLLTIPVTGPEIYLAKGYDIDWLILKECMEKVTGRKTKLVNVPSKVAMAMGWLFEKLTPYGKTPPLTRFLVKVLTTDTLFDDSKIRRTGFTPRYRLEETLQDAFDVPVT